MTDPKKKANKKLTAINQQKKWQSRKKKAKHWLANLANFPTFVLPNRPPYNIYKANKTKNTICVKLEKKKS